jgi:hypothetical protein
VSGLLNQLNNEFRLTSEEFEVLKSQLATSKTGSGGKQKQPLVFTERGIPNFTFAGGGEKVPHITSTWK